MRSFWLAWSFLTILPAPGQGWASAEAFVRSRVWYPAVGWVLGILLAGLAIALEQTAWSSGIRGALLAAAWLGLTGFLHFDGLVDSADALLVPKSPEERLKILKDVHHGSFALAVGSLYLLLLWQSLSSTLSPLLLLALPAWSRGWLLVPIHLWPYARNTTFDSSSLRKGDGLAGILPWVFPSLLSLGALALFPGECMAAALSSLLFCRWSAARLGGGITGDIYGASLLISELAAMLYHLQVRP